MQITCPNKSHPDFRKLIDKFGELKANMAYFKNGEEIPSVEVASKLLGEETMESRFDISPEESKSKAIWAMATTGKSYLAKQNPDKYIDFDEYLKPRKPEIKQLYKDGKEDIANEIIREEWRQAKQLAKSQGKTLFGSQQAILEGEEGLVDEIYYNDDYDDFRNKILTRNEAEETSEEVIKERFDSNQRRINNSKISQNKKASTKYLSEYLGESSKENLKIEKESSNKVVDMQSEQYFRLLNELKNSPHGKKIYAQISKEDQSDRELIEALDDFRNSLSLEFQDDIYNNMWKRLDQVYKEPSKEPEIKESKEDKNKSFKNTKLKSLGSFLTKENIELNVTSSPSKSLFVDGSINELEISRRLIYVEELAPLIIEKILELDKNRKMLEKHLPKNYKSLSKSELSSLVQELMLDNKKISEHLKKETIKYFKKLNPDITENSTLDEVNDDIYPGDMDFFVSESFVENASEIKFTNAVYGSLSEDKQTAAQKKISAKFKETDLIIDPNDRYKKVKVSDIPKHLMKDFKEVTKGMEYYTAYKLQKTSKHGLDYALHRTTNFQKAISNKGKTEAQIISQEENSEIYRNTGTKLHAIMENVILNRLAGKQDDFLYGEMSKLMNEEGKLYDEDIKDIASAIYNNVTTDQSFIKEMERYLASEESPFTSGYTYIDKNGKEGYASIPDAPENNYLKLVDMAISAYIKFAIRQVEIDWRTNKNKEEKDRVWNRVNIFAERTTYDAESDMGGSVDLLAVYSTGGYGILDYKFPKTGKFLGKGKPDLEDWSDTYFKSKDKSYSQQLMAYSQVMTNVYGATNLEFARIAPSFIQYTRNKDNKIDENSKIVNIYTADESLGYIPIISERTPNKKLNQFLDSLEKQVTDLESSLSKRRAWLTDFVSVEKLTMLRKVIMSVQTTGDLSLYNSYSKKFLITTNKLLSDGDVSKLTLSRINEITEELKYLQNYLGQDSIELMKNFKEDFPDEYENFRDEISELLLNMNAIKTSLDELRILKIREEALSMGMNKNVFDSFRNQSDIKGIQRSLISMKNQNHPLLQVFAQKVDRMNSQRIFFQKQMMDEQELLLKELTKWGNSKGLKGTDLFKPILNERKELLTPYTKEYYDLVKEYAAKEELGYEWFKENFVRSTKRVNGRPSDEELFQAAYKKRKEDLEIAEPDETIREEKLKAWLNKNDITREGFKNWENCYFKSPKDPERFYSEEYKNMMKPENKPLRDYYEFVIKMNLKFKEMIGNDVDIKYNLTPNIYKSTLDSISQDGTGPVQIFKDWWAGIKKDFNTEDKSKQQTGDNEIPLLFLDFIPTEEKSIDLSKNLILFGTFVNQYAHAVELEELSDAIEHVLRETPLIKKDKKGNKIINPSSDTGFEEEKALDSNILRALKTYKEKYVYSQNTIADGVSEMLGERGVRFVNKLQANRGRIAMAFNAVSATVGTINAITQIQTIASGNKYFTTEQFKQARYEVGKMDSKIHWANLYFEANSESSDTNVKANSSSVNALVRSYSKDVSYIFQRFADNIDEKVLLHCMLNNYGIDPETGVFTRLETLKKKYEDTDYKDKIIPVYDCIKLEDENDKSKGYKIINPYTGKSLDPKYDDVEDVIENNKNINFFSTVRSKVINMQQKIKGTVHPEDISEYRMTVVGRLLGQFKNWIPATMHERVKGEGYNITMEEFEVGKWTSLWNVSKGQFLSSLGNFMKAVAPFTDKSFSGLKTNPRMREMYDLFIKNNPDLEGVVSFDDYVFEYQSKLKSFAKEIQYYAALLTIILALIPLLFGGDDEEHGYLYNSSMTLLNRLSTELGFYVPGLGVKEFYKIVERDPMPIFTLGKDVFNWFSNTGDSLRDVFVGQNNEQDKTPPIFYTAKLAGLGNLARYIGITDTDKEVNSLADLVIERN